MVARYPVIVTGRDTKALYTPPLARSVQSNTISACMGSIRPRFTYLPLSVAMYSFRAELTVAKRSIEGGNVISVPEAGWFAAGAGLCAERTA